MPDYAGGVSLLYCTIFNRKSKAFFHNLTEKGGPQPAFFGSVSADILVHRAVGGAGAVVLAFLIHAECVPCGRTEDVLIGDVVHADGDAQHRAERDEIRADVAVGNRAVVCTPVLHDGVGALKRAAGLAVAARGEPGARPRGVRALHERVGDLLGQMHGPALGDLQHGAEAP